MDFAGQKRQRIVALDIMRGFFLFTIIVNHLYFFPSVFELLTGRGELWVSAAEGFFLISGILVGYIYTRKIRENGRAAIGKMFRRVGLLYFWAIALTSLALLWVHLDPGHPTKEGIWWQPNILEYLYKVMTLQYNYGWSDFLQYYVLFMLFAPLAVWLCVRGKAWLAVAASVGIWLFRGQNFDMAWQLLFMGGIVLGYYLPRIEGWWNMRSEQNKRRATWALCVPAGLTLLASIVVIHGPGFITLLGSHAPGWLTSFQPQLLDWRAASGPSTDKWSLAPARLVLIALWFSALYLFVRTNERRIDRLSFGFFRRIGEVSLLVYGIHSLVVLGVHMYVPTDFGFIGNTTITAIILAAIYFAIRWRTRLRSLALRLVPWRRTS
jgi:peptidoglycan/LPS O-acetylase OafA/YrhL